MKSQGDGKVILAKLCLKSINRVMVIFSSLSYFISTLKTKLRVPTVLSDMV